ncbi:hypothetical protein F511_45450 [Dorcoceras hygrometricum]|uniref:Uncharacterized protein n=1 Tax=Dorcoceras hygrometricum TaxID=472368 RepID=A0A2Z6ZVZ7_9LAMI|nr:hypothetical protein F511_45450 [Dorcoceras hygrometricum]
MINTCAQIVALVGRWPQAMGGRCCDGRRPLRHDARAGRALVASACALAARENLEVAPPAGRHSGESLAMSRRLV